jgi:hypothetical protein
VVSWVDEQETMSRSLLEIGFDEGGADARLRAAPPMRHRLARGSMAIETMDLR